MIEKKICAGCGDLLEPRFLLTSYYFECALCAAGGDSSANTATTGEGVVTHNTQLPLPVFSLEDDIDFDGWSDCYLCKNTGCGYCYSSQEGRQ